MNLNLTLLLNYKLDWNYIILCLYTIVNMIEITNTLL